jgi:hypothetical protein
MIGTVEPPDFSRMFDFQRLMDGENRDSKDPDDIRHWCAVYKDLIEFKGRLLGETREHITTVPEAATELGGNDLPFLMKEMERLRRGLEFWEKRRVENLPG